MYICVYSYIWAIALYMVDHVKGNCSYIWIYIYIIYFPHLGVYSTIHQGNCTVSTCKQTWGTWVNNWISDEEQSSFYENKITEGRSTLILNGIYGTCGTCKRTNRWRRGSTVELYLTNFGIFIVSIGFILYRLPLSVFATGIPRKRSITCQVGSTTLLQLFGVKPLPCMTTNFSSCASGTFFSVWKILVYEYPLENGICN